MGKQEVYSFPSWVVPMAATLTQERFTGSEWLFEQKLDGIRLLAFRDGADVRLLSRNQLPQHCPEIANAILQLPVHDVILDGEAVWTTRSVTYHVFDIMWIDGRDVTHLPLEERRALLKKLPLARPLARVKEIVDEKPWERASVGGFTDPQGGRVGLGALLVGHYDGGDFVFAGKVGTGFDTKLLLDLRRRLDAIEIPSPPFTKAKGLPRLRAHWVRPQLVVQVAFIEWTVHGKLRHPRLLGVRTDKSARDVVRETP